VLLSSARHLIENPLVNFVLVWVEVLTYHVCDFETFFGFVLFNSLLIKYVVLEVVDEEALVCAHLRFRQERKHSHIPYQLQDIRLPIKLIPHRLM